MKIPEFIENLLQSRRKLAYDLRYVCEEIDEYCNRIGVDMLDSGDDIAVYCEPDKAYQNTRFEIERTLHNREYYKQISRNNYRHNIICGGDQYDG